MKAHWGALLGIFLPWTCSGLESEPRFTVYTLEHGLPQESILDITEDETGFLWLATQDGLARFDGHDFRVYRPVRDDPLSLSDNYITRVCDGGQGRIWVGTRNGGLNLLDLKAERVTRFRSDPTNEHSIPSNWVGAVRIGPGGRTFVGTRNGLAIVNPDLSIDRVVVPPATGLVTELLFDLNGQLWVATEEAGILVFDSNLSLKDRHLAEFRAPVRDLLETSDGSVLAATDQGVVELSAPDSPRWVVAGYQEMGAPVSLLHGAHGEVWVGTSRALVRLDIHSGGKTIFRHRPGNPESIPIGVIESLHRGRDGTLWVGSWDGGLGAMPPSIGLQSLGQKTLGDPRVWGIAEAPDGTVWITSPDGLKFIDQARSELIVPDGFRNLRSGVLEFDQTGALWADLNRSGMLVRFGLDGQLEYQLDLSKSIGSTVADIDALSIVQGQVFIGTDQGLLLLEIETRSLSWVLRSGEVHSLYKDASGAVWIATSDQGLAVFSDDTLRRFAHDPDDPNSISHNSVTGILVDQSGQLWAATSAGLNRMFEAEGETRFQRYSRDTGFESDAFGAILEDDTGMLWLSSTKGISRFDPETEAVSNFGRTHGALRGSYYVDSYLKATDGTFYFGGQHGLTFFQPDQIADRAPPRIAFTRILVDGEVVRGSSVNFVEAVTFPLGSQEMAIEFAALEFGASQLIEYAYQLEGVHRERIRTDSKHRRVTVSNLRPGDYLLRVWATNASGRWSENSTNLTVVVPTPWWHTWWARFGGATVAVLLFVSFVRWRTNRLRVLANWLEDEVDQRTEELRESYENVRTLSEIGLEIGSTLDLGSIMNSLYENIRRLMPADSFGIGLYDATEEVIRIELAIERGKRYAPYTRDMTDKNQLPVWCVENREPVFINDLDLEFRNYIEEYQSEMEIDEELENGEAPQVAQSQIYLPLMSHDRLLGIISVQSYEKHAYEPRHLDLLQTLASYTASALENVRALDEVSRSEDETRTLLRISELTHTATDSDEFYSEIHNVVRSLMLADNLFILVRNPAGEGVRFEYISDATESKTLGEMNKRPQEVYRSTLTAYVMDTGRALHLGKEQLDSFRNEHGLTAMGVDPEDWLAVPLIGENGSFGALVVQTYDPGTGYKESDVELLEFVSRHVANAVQRKWASDALLQAYKSVRTLSEIGLEIGSTLDLDQIMQSLYDNVCQLMPADVFGIGLYDPGQSIIRFEFAIERGKRYAPYFRDMGDKNQLAVWCVENRKPVYINRITQESSDYVGKYNVEKELDAAQLQNGGTPKVSHSQIYLPLMSRERLLGVITVQAYAENAYEPRHLDLLQMLATYAASALENAGALEEVTRNQDELRALDEIIMTVNREVELNSVLDSLLRQGLQLIPDARNGVAVMYDENLKKFRFVASVGYDMEALRGERLDQRQTIEFFMTKGRSVARGMYLLKNIEDTPYVIEAIGLPASALAMALTARREVAAFVVFDHPEDANAFDEVNYERLVRFREHALSAVEKAQLLRQSVDQQRQLAQSERMAALGVLTAGVAHEINNPTNFAHAGGQNLKAELVKFRDYLHEIAGDEAEDEVLQAIDERVDRLGEHLEVVLEGNQRIKHIVNDLRNFTRIDGGEVKSVDVVEMLETTLRLTRTRYKEGIEFISDLEARPRIECQPARLNQVFMNILVNACQAIEERLAYDPDQQGQVDLRTRIDGPWLEIEIQDNGVGMSEATRERIFEPFFTTKPVGSGTGLGLSITFAAIEELGGELRVDSEPGHGATFLIRLPLVPGQT